MSPNFQESKVVVVGGSYAGNLAAWMKLLYPALVDAALASSAPVLAKKDFYEYFEKVSDDFEIYGTPGCLNKISEIFSRYDKLFQTSSGIEQLKEEEQICGYSDMTKAENRQYFFLRKTYLFATKTQYGSPKIIEEYCEQIIDTSHVLSTKEDDSIWSEKEQCYNYDFYHMKDVSPWFYQTCTEFGYYVTTTSKKQPFTDNIPGELFYKLCKQSFGPDFDEKRIDEGIMNTNLLYGGLNPNVTNVVFSNGDLDPFSRLGILADISSDAHSKVIPFVSHCADLSSDTPDDPEELIQSRKYTKDLIKKWIGAGEFKQLA